jgi:glycosyltransferase involved in cell wall biosynthesis
MKRLEVIIPTRNRLQKLLRTLETIPGLAGGIEIRIVVICDGDRRTAEHVMLSVPKVSRLTYVQRHSGAVYCRNLATQAADDGVLYATDDITFHPGSIDIAVNAFEEKFPDDDGVVGFNQSNHGHFSRAGVAIVGQKFLRRYPDRKLFYPKYFHFACQEVARASLELGKYFFCEAACLTHHHPMLERAERDLTHVEARKWKDRDRQISSERERAGLTWGVNG